MHETPSFWHPTRDEGLARLASFLPSAGRAYAAKRNYDFGPEARTNVSVLSPYIRHRLISESEVVEAVLGVHSQSAAEKFIQEICWRTYWKGWLEQRPQVWADYLGEVAAQRDRLREDDALAAEVAAAIGGRTGIACFDAWARELVDTGYLHNHARMWFASIWIFTLRLPWVLGADFFLRHLLDGDPASNTLSWRWVGGLHTRGKTYLARADNIATYTAGRHSPGRGDLAPYATPLEDAEAYERVAVRTTSELPRGAPAILLVTEEDLSPETWPLGDLDIRGVGILAADEAGSTYAPAVLAFKRGARADAAARASVHWRRPVVDFHVATELVEFARTCGATAIVTTLAPIGHVQAELDRLALHCRSAGVPVHSIARRWDSLFWPHAKAGFFQLKERIPAVIAKLELDKQRTLL